MKPILFSTPMVQAILEGRKTMTRRIMKGQPQHGAVIAAESAIQHNKPRFKIGDILYVRETWTKDERGEYVYRTNYGTTEDDSFPPSMFKWKPSLFMPKEAARIFLRVTNVRAEQLKDIKLGEIEQEGVKITDKDWLEVKEGDVPPFCFFEKLWDKINGAGAYNQNPWVWVYDFERVEKP